MRAADRPDRPDRPLDVPLGSPTRPTWRGRLHMLALWTAIPLVVALAIVSNGARARSAVIVYGVGLCAMLAASTTYHRWVHTLRARTAWRRVDHAAIFLAIAGTSTALTLTSLGTGAAIAMLVVVWAAAVAGIVFTAASFERANRYGAVVYIVMGWSGLLLMPAVWARGGVVAAAFLVGGGVMYTLGALAFSRRWPTLRPARFSYHEVWHAFTIAAASLHFVAIATLAT